MFSAPVIISSCLIMIENMKGCRHLKGDESTNALFYCKRYKNVTMFLVGMISGLPFLVSSKIRFSRVVQVSARKGGGLNFEKPCIDKK